MLERDQVPPELGALYDALLKQRGAVPNMIKTVANTPGLALAFAALLKPLLGDGALPGWYKELVATRMSVLLGSGYAVTGHALSAKQKGASDAQIAAVKSDFDHALFLIRRSWACAVLIACTIRLAKSMMRSSLN